MKEENKNSLQYRFSGYQLPMIQLDSTGPAYYVTGIHPYYINQPEYWTKPAYQNNRLIENNPLVLENKKSNSPPTDTNKSTINLYKLSNF
jgi:hypothetical protein